MGNITHEEITELKKLQGLLKEQDELDDRIKKQETLVKNARKFPEYSPQLKTDNCKTRRSEMIREKEKKGTRTRRLFWLVAIVVFVAAIIVWRIMVTPSEKNPSYLYTPEIVREYSGLCYTVSNEEVEGTLTIESCNPKGELKGTFSFLKENRFNEIYNQTGSYRFKGTVLSKSRDSYITAELELTVWEERKNSSVRAPWEKIQIKIYDDYRVLHCFDNEMWLYTDDYKRSPVEDLYTPEIIKEYSGNCKIRSTCAANISITDCDNSGRLAATFEYFLNDVPAKCEIEGQITKKYDDGYVEFDLYFPHSGYGWTIEPSDMYFPNGSQHFVIFNDFRSIECTDYYVLYINWFYEDEGFTKDPDKVEGPMDYIKKKAPLAIFVIYPVLVIIISIFIARKNPEKLTQKEQSELDRLTALDKENEAENDRLRKEYEIKKRDECVLNSTRLQEKLDNLLYERSVLQAKIDAITVLAPCHKKEYTVNFVISRLAGQYADSIKEALLQLEKKNKEDIAEIIRENERIISQRHQEEFEQKLLENQAAHNRAVEKELNKQTKEIEELRKNIED